MFQQDHHVIHNQVAGTSEWPTLVSHVIGSFVGHSPNDMLCPPAYSKLWTYSWTPVHHVEANERS